MAKARKRSAPTKAETTRSRTPAPAEQRTLQIDKLGRVITWNVPDAPYADDSALRAAFIGGFEARVRHVNHSSDEGIPQRFNAGTKLQRALEDGYNEAARQDGEDLKPKTLVGRNPPPKIKTRR